MAKKWTNEMLFAEAKKYQHIVDFKKGSYGAYQACINRGINLMATAHMTRKIKWTIENLKVEALKYNFRSDFYNGSMGAYSYCKHHNLLDMVCVHMKSKRVKWTLDLLREEALKYTSRSEFQKNSPSAYTICIRDGVLDLVCNHLPKQKKWKKDNLKTLSLKYKHRSVFKRMNQGAYNACRKMGILDEVCSHMVRPKCINGFNPTKPAILYYLSVNNGEAYKIGITNRTVKLRYSQKDLDGVSDYLKIEILKEVPYEYGQDALDKEQEILNKYHDFKYTGVDLLKNGNTELFSTNIIQYL